MKKLFTILCFLLLTCNGYLKADEFVAKHGVYEKNGEKIKVYDLRGLPVFYADYYPNEDAVKIKCSAGNLVLKRGTFFYAYRGVKKGLVITATAYVENGVVNSIVYEEWNKVNDNKAILTYYKK